MAQLKGFIDVVTIDNNGSPHIFDLKLSKKSYRDWDSVKFQQTDWQLVLYRQLLSQYMPMENSTINVLPIELGDLVDGKLLPHNMIYIQPEVRKVSLKFETIAQKLIPRGVFTSYDPIRRKSFLETLEVIFPEYEIKTTSEEDNVEKIVAAARKKGK